MKDVVLKKRKAGILLPVFSLPGKYGTGDFGKSSKNFIDLISEMGFGVWQVLPVLMPGSGNSPYSGDSAFAGNFAFIDPESIDKRLLEPQFAEMLKYSGSPYKVDYAKAREIKSAAIKHAFHRLESEDYDAISAFYENEKGWLDDYALYMAIKKNTDGKPFREWDAKLLNRETEALNSARKTYADDYNYYIFEQYLFYKQWQELKNYAKNQGVEIFGDIPIYLSGESVDVWAHPELFELDNNLNPKRVAGVPPDYFSKEGQLWNNPLYNYAKMKEDGYEWWINRLAHNLELYDLLRIDHFRGLSDYWAVPRGQINAIGGEWVPAPGIEIFNELKKRIANPKIVAEDLGIIDCNVVELLEKTGFPGMRVLQFAFDGDPANTHLPHNYDKNTVAYTGTHDNNTLFGWLYELTPEVRKKVLKYIGAEERDWSRGGKDAPAVRAAIKEVIASVANLAVIPIQDLLGYGGDTRVNIPGVAEGNWEYRLTEEQFNQIDKNYMSELLRTYNR